MSILQQSFTGSHHESTIYMMKMSMTDKPFQQFHVLRVLKGKHADNQTLYKCTIEECPAMFTVERLWGSKTLHVNTIRDHDFSYSMPQQVRLKRSMCLTFFGGGGDVYACGVCIVFSDFRTHNHLLITSQYYTLNVMCVCVCLFLFLIFKLVYLLLFNHIIRLSKYSTCASIFADPSCALANPLSLSHSSTHLPSFLSLSSTPTILSPASHTICSSVWMVDLFAF